MLDLILYLTLETIFLKQDSDLFQGLDQDLDLEISISHWNVTIVMA